MTWVTRSMPNPWCIFPTLGKLNPPAEPLMNGKNGRFLRFSQIGTPPAMLRASPMTGLEKHQGSGNKIMNANAAYYRNAFFSVALSVAASLVIMAGTAGLVTA
ncbi:hypothetical protein J2W22_002637 [Sphingomonas kyeonggiensis]|uniref:hypothetical protein n=1 Tax=Sphingomonas kyeonggiensis TaxID=1268553 RepID=UPI0027848954|nr:hypothetical protein [Sphingomonas kyeonggiensis]MDQ0250573.1 hypothetical protein [Sphingomonas kyeonggiensis]